MNCPQCGGRMEGEPFNLCTGYVLSKVPAVAYRCDDCDAEYQRIGIGPLRKITDGGRAELTVRRGVRR